MARNLFEGENLQEIQRQPRNLFENDGQQEEGFLQKLPRNIGIGLVHAGRDLHNFPHDLAQGIDVVGSSIGRFLGAPEFQKKDTDIASYLPYDEYDYSNVLGQRGQPTPTDRLVQMGTEFAPQIWSGLNALRSIRLAPHLTKYGATRTLNQAKGLAASRNIGQLNINPELIEDARQFLPNTVPYRNALDASQHGDYNSLFGLQSDVGKNASNYAKSWFSAAERAHGKEGLAARNRLLNALHEELQSQGHSDISQLLRKGQDEYRRYMGFRPYRNALGIAAAAYAAPKNPLTDLVKKIIFHNIGQ